MYEKAIYALRQQQPLLAIELIVQEIKEQEDKIINIMNQNEQQEPFDFAESVDFIPTNGWEAA